MRRQLPPMNALVVFEVVARENSFTGAAKALRIAQPAVTRHIAKLEDWIGVKLFIRKGNAIDLAPAGAELAELCTPLFDRLELGTQAITSRGAQELVIGASFGMTHLWLMPRVNGLQSQAQVPFNFLTSDDYRSFDSPSVDMSIRFGTGDFGDKCVDLLCQETCQIVASPAWLKAHPGFDPENPAGTAPSEHLLDHRDTFGVGWMRWQVFSEILGHGWPETRQLRSVQSYPLMLDMVRRGEGICIGTHSLEDALVASGDLCRVGPVIERPGYGHFLVYDKERLTDPAFCALRDALVSGATEGI